MERFGAGPLVYDVYFERSLGYVQFSNASELNTRELLDVLEPSLVWQREAKNTSG